MNEKIRIEVGFDGGQVMSAQVSAEAADGLEHRLSVALQDGGNGAYTLEAEDGHYVLALPRIVYVKRFARESRLGFGST